ncbi:MULTISPECIES: hypothetical protein [Rhizobium]|uniref:hypothetical protein n=1 Tax=Rhizobium TaxID=379 RepID=UPI001A8EE89E|nr:MULTISPECIES: hypothetical protein [Rhizobium]MBN9981859.1 hypothetical protein [Rhizobium laguerreae]MBY5660694.1 hypothetical protein [Rhizobium leguminosarum]MBY5674729.1 hypothetical protein [Rhizobium leguminosarum]
MISEIAWRGVNVLLDEYVQINTEDHVIIAFSPDSGEAAAWVSAALAMRGVIANRVPMIPLTDPDFALRFTAILPPTEAISGRLVVLTFERETMSHDEVIRRALAHFNRDQCAVFRSISSCEELFSTALLATPEMLSGINTTLLERCMPAERLRITARGGTELLVGINSTRHRWISNRGRWRPGNFVILPAGEVATYPASISGILVADFAFNVNALTERSARLVEHPVTVWIEDNRAVRYECDDAEVSHFLDQCFNTYCAHNVGELGLGTNYHIKSAIALNSHINERRPGVHLGFGQHNQGPGVEYQCNIHLDLIASGGKLWVDDDREPIDLENISPSSAPHPSRTRDEDVFSPRIDELDIDDCCGILTKEGLQLFNCDTGNGEKLLDRP